jgi:hypothetical protein
MTIRVALERSPKAKKLAAIAVDRASWSHGASTPEGAVATLKAYRETLPAALPFLHPRTLIDAIGTVPTKGFTNPGQKAISPLNKTRGKVHSIAVVIKIASVEVQPTWL